MSSLAVLGCMWGDEAKAKIVDYLGSGADVVVRFQGGANAGHTIVLEGRKYVFHSIPSGILNPGCACVIGAGVVVDIPALLEEMDALRAQGIGMEGRLFIDERCSLVLPLHRELDGSQERSLAGNKIGTTGRGIGPAYSDRAARRALRLNDLEYPDWTRDRLRGLYEYHHLPADGDSLAKECAELQEMYARLKEFVAATDRLLYDWYRADKMILFEGAQGTLLDLDYGTYPYVTSSHTIAGGISTGTGLPPRFADKVIGVYKAYGTRVGEGPFPTELFDATGDRIREKGHEYGSTTGRPRRVGWFDAVAAAYSARVNGVNTLAVTLLDVLSGLEEIKICTGYWDGDIRLRDFPSHPLKLASVRPEYLTLPGWERDITDCASLGKLPSAAREYLEAVQDLLERPVELVSVGRERHQTIVIKP